MPRNAASRMATGSASSSRAGETVLRATVTERVQPGVVYTTFHFPESGANVITTDNSDWATNCPEYKVTAVQVMQVDQPSEWQQQQCARRRGTAEACWRGKALMNPIDLLACSICRRVHPLGQGDVVYWRRGYETSTLAPLTSTSPDPQPIIAKRTKPCVVTLREMFYSGSPCKGEGAGSF